MKPSLENKWLKIAVHVAAWILVFSLPYLLRHSYDNARPNGHQPPPFTLFTAFIDLTWIGLFYLNTEVLVPLLTNKRKVTLFIVSQLVAFAAILLLHYFMFTCCFEFKDHEKRPFNILIFIDFNIVLFILDVAASIAYRMIADKFRAEDLEKEKQKENLKTELSFLRSQISPHFMFNVLNNIVALVRLKSEKLEPTIFKLSSLMRYMLYQSDEKKVPLKKEIEYLQSYIDLQQLRYGDKVGVNVAINVPDGQLEIEPMLLIPFVENAFKHGTTYITSPQIEIEMLVKNRMLYFMVSNKFSSNKDETKDDTSGIGLTNVQRRLKLLYGADHELHILEKDGWFSVSLQLKLHDVTMYSN
ncbi:GHKL domain-containing protein [Filimonas lacunae]|uniref:GHKL domain-containing protein n=1 Tax=Filimonas lacunae TaxID=477680 RepID=A0A173MCE2_9BACT|nr:histidine kinase [Filimonas lacunae]BAV05196.1 two-component system sensor protein, no kinase domain [Filimonas lacunae]SIT22695.1 GHKL domain-containing protein [Filimonas lacunae]